MTPHQIITTIQQHTGANPLMPTRRRNIAYTRYLCIYYISLLCGMSDYYTARIFNRERSSCSMARKVISNGIDAVWAKEDVNKLNELLCA